MSFTSALPTKLPLFSGVAARAVQLIYSSDSAAGREAFRIIVVWGDSAKGSETLRLSLNVADSGRGSETVKLSLAIADIGRGIESFRQRLAVADVARGVEAYRTTITVADRGLGTESYRLALLVSDAGRGAETLKPSITSSDVARGIEAFVQRVLVGDTAKGYEVYRLLLLATDKGAGLETYMLLLKISDIGVGAEAYRLGLRVSDSGRGIEVSKLLLTALDLSRGVEAYRLSLKVFDYAKGSEALRLGLSVVDTGKGLDIYLLRLALADYGIGIEAQKQVLLSIDLAKSVETFSTASKLVSYDYGYGSERYSIGYWVTVSDGGRGYEAWITASKLLSSDYAKSIDVAMTKLHGLDSAKSFDALFAREFKFYDYAKSFELNVPVRQPIRTVDECLDLLSKILPEIDFHKEVRSYHFNYPYECAKLAVDLLGKAIQKIVEKGLYRKRWNDVVALKDVIDLYLEAQRFVDGYRLLKSMDILTPDHENFLIEIIHDVWQALQKLVWITTPTLSIEAEDWLRVRAWLKPEVLYRIAQIDVGRGVEKYLAYPVSAVLAQSTIKLEDVAEVAKLISFTVSETLQITSTASIFAGFVGRDIGRGLEVYRVSIVIPIASSATVKLEDIAKAIRIVNVTALDMLSLSSSATPLVSYTIRIVDSGRGVEAHKTSIIVPIASRSSISLTDVASIVHTVTISVSEHISISTLASPSLTYTLRFSDSGVGAEVYTFRRIVGDISAGKEVYRISVKVDVKASSSIGLTDAARAVALHPILASESLRVSSTALPSIRYSITIVDRAIAGETYRLMAGVSGADKSVGAERYVLTARMSLTDLARGKDVYSLTTRVTVIDLSRGLEAFSLSSRTTASDAGKGLDTYSVTRYIPISATSSISLLDSAHAIAIHSISVAERLSISSTASISVKVTVAVSDRGRGVEAYGVTRREAISASSKVSFTDSASISVRHSISASDSLSIRSSSTMRNSYKLSLSESLSIKASASISIA
jgi:hypothetical protein